MDFDKNAGGGNQIENYRSLNTVLVPLQAALE